MKYLVRAAAVVLCLSFTPSFAANSVKKDKASDHSPEIRTDNMHKNPDGTFQGKPVVDGPADWSQLYSPSSTGSASGESGSNSSNSK